MVDLTETTVASDDESSSNSQTAQGLRRVMKEVLTSTTSDAVTRIESAGRKGICYLIREIAVHGSTFAILRFVREVSDPRHFTDYEHAARVMAELSEVRPSDVPALYYALAGDVFATCALKMEKARKHSPTRRALANSEGWAGG